MSTFNGFKRRITAATRALKGEYVVNQDKKPTAVLPKKCADNSVNEVKAEVNVLINDKKTVEALDPDYCTGCSACRNVCPVDAITMEYNGEGFLAPVVNLDKCVQCGLCLKQCPSANPVYKNLDRPKCYAAFGSDEIREKSSSGGLFTMVADKILAQGGYVCGAAFDDKFVLKHMVVNDEAGMEKLRESKYVQSDPNVVYREIGKLLKDEKPVLFSGCGCQVAALYSYLSAKKISDEKLFTIDLMCHGSPSPKLFEKYINEVHGGPDNIEKLSFRTKEYYGWSTEMNVKYKDGSEYHKIKGLDPYYKAFLPCVSVRKSCGHCPTAKLPRQGDITLADFWGVRALNKDYDDAKGTSILIINNDKGQKMVEDIKGDFKLYKEVDIEYILTHGQPFDHTFKTHPAHDLFFKNINLGMSVEKAFDYSVNRKFDVAIMGVWPGCNYGSVATYYALHQIITSFGLSVLMIDKPIIRAGDPEQGNNHSRRFAEEHYEISRKYKLGELKKLNQNVDTFIMGCDQVWNRGISKNFGYAYYFNFVDDSKKKLSYAASFGHAVDFAGTSDRKTISEFMKRFDAISVREADGVRICKESYDVEATQVLDPVFVVDKEEFIKLTEQSAANNRPNKEEKFITTYILDPTPEKKEALKWVSEKLGYKLINLLDGLPWTVKKNTEKMQGMGEIPENVQVEDWLYYIKNCEFLVTDSCHGISFGIIFERPFIGIGNKRRGMSRFNSLLGLFNLKHRFVTDPKDIIGNEELLQPIDYKPVNEILESEKARSKKWLKDALFSPKKINSRCVYPVIDSRIDDIK